MALMHRYASSHALHVALESADEEAIRGQLEWLKQVHEFSFLHLTTASGEWLFESRQAFSRQTSLWRKATQGEASQGVEIYQNSDLMAESLELVRATSLPLIDTPRAKESERTVEDRGMMVRSIAPIFDAEGVVIALIDGGVLLNHNFEFVDALRDLVYGKGNLAEGSIGTVTIFLDDVRISTNVPLRPGERALGTRVSQEVRSQVLEQGKSWIDRAFVVNDWYISAYEPIVDSDGNRVGILYAGFLEKPYRSALWHAFAALIMVFLVLILMSALLAFYGARGIFRPLEKMSDVLQATGRGDPLRRIGDIASEDEIGNLAREIDVMLGLLGERQQQLQAWNDKLELKVDERTVELKEKNSDLERTVRALRGMRHQLVLAEKLAALGELTAGVAHEINNPAQVILGNLDTLKMELGDSAEPVEEEIQLIIQQVYRIQKIINHLLQYARPTEYSSDIQQLDANAVVDRSLRLVDHLQKNSSVKIELELLATQSVELSPVELEQVLVNLLSNAIHALPDKGGAVEISTCNWEVDKGVVIQVRDNGCGIPHDQLEHIFNPFFSTRDQGEGTGLGLSISYGLIRRYGGSITAKSELGKGAEFSVWLLAEPKLIEDEKTILDQLKSIEEESGSKET